MRGVAGFGRFFVELRGSEFAESAGEIARALERLDIEADGNPDAERMLTALEIIANKSGSIGERLADMHKVTSARGKVVVEFRCK